MNMDLVYHNGLELPDAAADLARRERNDELVKRVERQERGLPLSPEWLAEEQQLVDTQNAAYHEQKDLGDLLYWLIGLREVCQSHERFAPLLPWLQVQIDHWQAQKETADEAERVAMVELRTFIFGSKE